MTTSSYQRSCRLINSVEAREWRRRPFSVKFADFLTTSFGTFSFLLFNFSFFAFWIMANTGKLKSLGIPVFDPHPFFFLTMIVSLEAIFLSIIVLISQNRQSQIAKFRDELDLQINLIAEREITKVLKILKEIKGESIRDEELEEMLVETNTSYIERQLEKQIFEKSTSVVEEIIKPVEKIEKTLREKLSS